MMVLPYHQ
jgi:RNA recognition motif-containing protein